MDCNKIYCKICNNDITYTNSELIIIDNELTVQCPYCMNTIKI